MKSPALSTAIKTRAPILILTGDCDYLIGRALSAVQTHMIPTGDRDLNLTILDGTTTASVTADKILTLCRTPPLFAKRRLIVVQDPPSAVLAELLKYLSTPCKTTTLCLVAPSLDGRTKFAAAAKAAGVVVTLDQPKENELPGVLTDEAARLKIPIHPTAIPALIAAQGTDLAILIDGLVRCGLFVPIGHPVTADTVNKVVASARVDSVFAITDALSTGNRAAALAVLENLIANRTEPIAILALITAHVRKVWQAAAYETAQAATQGLGVHPFYAGKLWTAAKALGPDRIEKLHTGCYRADQAIKGGRTVIPRMILEELILGVL